MYGDLNMTYTTDNRLATFDGQAVTYDAEGNMLNGPLGGTMQDYQYDARNRLTQAGGASYGYDNENNRNSITVNGVTTKQIINPHAVMSQVLMETDAVETPQAWYVYGLGLIGHEDAAGSYQTYHYDLRGSTVALTDEQGQVTDTYTYDTYGERLSHEGASTQPFQYNGRDGVQTDVNGLYQMRARYYNPEIKRFVNRDVLSGSIGNGLTMNRYAYVNGNPVSFIDPFGLSADGATWWQTGLSFVADATPFVGTIKGIQEVFSGVDLITGQQMSVTDRVATGVGTAASLIPFGKHIGKYLTKEGIDGGAWLIGKLKKTPVQTVEPRDYRLKLDLQLFGGTSAETIDLYRAVTPEEFDDIMATGKFRFGPRSMDAKQFGHVGEEVLNLANTRIMIDTAAIVKTTIPRSAFEQFDHTPLDTKFLKSGATTVLPEMLELLNKSIKNIDHWF